MWTRLTGRPEEELLVSLWENLPENVMETGSIFPEPGQEQQWLSKPRQADRIGHARKVERRSPGRVEVA